MNNVPQATLALILIEMNLTLIPLLIWAVLRAENWRADQMRKSKLDDKQMRRG